VQTSGIRRVVFIEQFFHPEGWGGAQLPRDITIDLSKAGCDVEVICGSDQYAPVEGGGQADPGAFGVRIRRIPRLLQGDIHRAKLARQVWFYLCALPLLAIRRRPHLFVTQTNPPLVVPLVALVARLLRRPYMIIAQDIYPEVMLAHGMLSGRPWFERSLSRLFAWAYRHASAVISLGPVMTERLLAKGVPRERVVEICNWATGDESVCRGPTNELRDAWNLSGRSVLLYSGNLGIAHDVETPIRAMAMLRSSVPDLVLVFIGKGSRLAEARALADELAIGDVVRFHDFVPFDLLPHSLGLADAALVTLRPGFEGLVVPSKLLGYMARSIPTLYVGPDSDVARFVKASGGGECVGSGDIEKFVAVVERWMVDPLARSAAGANASSYYRQNLSREAGLDAYRAAVDGAAFPDERA